MFLMNLWNLMMLHGLVVKPNPGSGACRVKVFVWFVWFCEIRVEL